MKYGWLICFFSFVTCVSAQTQPKIHVDHNVVPTVTVSHETLTDMCQNFEKKLGHKSISGVITFRPKIFPLRQQDKSGSVWIVRNMSRQIEILRSELPVLLQRISGGYAQNVYIATCYTQLNPPYTLQDVVITMFESADADALEKLLRH